MVIPWRFPAQPACPPVAQPSCPRCRQCHRSLLSELVCWGLFSSSSRPGPRLPVVAAAVSRMCFLWGLALPPHFNCYICPSRQSFR